MEVVLLPITGPQAKGPGTMNPTTRLVGFEVSKASTAVATADTAQTWLWGSHARRRLDGLNHNNKRMERTHGRPGGAPLYTQRR